MILDKENERIVPSAECRRGMLPAYLFGHYHAEFENFSNRGARICTFARRCLRHGAFRRMAYLLHRLRIGADAVAI
jgi:hypothetical protein